MASYSVAANEVGAWEKTAVAATVDTVTFADDLPSIRVINESTTVGLYATPDGSTPVVAGAASYYVPPGMALTIPGDPSGAGTVVKVISSGTPKYSVSRAV